MAEIAIVLTLDGTIEQFTAFCKSLAGLDAQPAELVLVRSPKSTIDDEALELLEREYELVEAEGPTGALWNAGVEKTTAEYIYLASCSIRLSPAFHRVLRAQIDAIPLDLLFFHLQEFDLSTRSYASKRLSARLSLPPEPFQPARNPERLLQRLGMSASNVLFARRYLEERSATFYTAAPFDDEPVLPQLVLSADSIARMPWPLAVMSYQTSQLFDAIDEKDFLTRYESFKTLYGDGLPQGLGQESFLAWAVSYASKHIEHAPNELASRMLDAIADTILPIIGDKLDEHGGAISFEGGDKLVLCTLDRMDLINMVLDLRNLGGEERYRAEALHIVNRRLAAGSSGVAPQRRKGLFGRR